MAVDSSARALRSCLTRRLLNREHSLCRTSSCPASRNTSSRVRRPAASLPQRRACPDSRTDKPPTMRPHRPGLSPRFVGGWVCEWVDRAGSVNVIPSPSTGNGCSPASAPSPPASTWVSAARPATDGEQRTAAYHRAGWPSRHAPAAARAVVGPRSTEAASASPPGRPSGRRHRGHPDCKLQDRPGSAERGDEVAAGLLAASTGFGADPVVLVHLGVPRALRRRRPGRLPRRHRARRGSGWRRSRCAVGVEHLAATGMATLRFPAPGGRGCRPGLSRAHRAYP